MIDRTSAPTSRLVSPVLAGAALLLLTASLSGCSALMNELHKVHDEHFTTVAEADDGWVGVDRPAWIPDDARDLRNLATTNEISAVIRVQTDSDPVGCEPAERRSLPFDDPGWVDLPAELPDEVLACGDYEVVDVGRGLVGWFNGTEQGDVPGA